MKYNGLRWDSASTVSEVQQKELYLAETGHKIVVRCHYSTDRMFGIKSVNNWAQTTMQKKNVYAKTGAVIDFLDHMINFSKVKQTVETRSHTQLQEREGEILVVVFFFRYFPQWCLGMNDFRKEIKKWWIFQLKNHIQYISFDICMFELSVQDMLVIILSFVREVTKAVVVCLL